MLNHSSASLPVPTVPLFLGAIALRSHNTHMLNHFSASVPVPTVPLCHRLEKPQHKHVLLLVTSVAVIKFSFVTKSISLFNKLTFVSPYRPVVALIEIEIQKVDWEKQSQVHDNVMKAMGPADPTVVVTSDDVEDGDAGIDVSELLGAVEPYGTVVLVR